MAKTPTLDEIRRDICGKPQAYGLVIERAEAMPGGDDEKDSRMVTLSFASDKPIEHWFGALKLSINKKSCRTERFDNGAALLLDHNWRSQIGVIETYDLDEKAGFARATVRFSRSEKGEEIYQDVLDGIRRNVSVGFMVHEIELESEKKGEPPVYRSNDWEPYEVSIVAVPADISVGVGRAFALPPTSFNAQEERKHQSNEVNMDKDENAQVPATEPVEVRVSDAVQTAQEIRQFGELLGEPELARQVILDGGTIDTFRTLVRTKRAAATTTAPERVPEQATRDVAVQLATALPRYGVVRNFKGENAQERAHRFGQWALATVFGRQKAVEFCRTQGIQIARALTEGTNETGGFLVPDEFGNDLIDLREQYGVFRRNAKIVPMMSDTRSDPRRTGGLTAYFVDEGDAITTSDKTWDRVRLTAKKLGVLVRMSSEVSEDAVISLGDDLAGEIGYAFANKEDECGFNGDGSSTYGGIVGVREALKGLSGTIANIAGLKVGTGNAYSELTLADFRGTVALLPQYADTPNAKWFVHRSFYYDVMVGLLLAGGGVTANEIEAARNKNFLGYAVEFAQVLPKAEANSQVCALLGDLSLGASLGTRRGVTLAVSEHSRFSTDELELRGTQRFDINVHSVGNASGTASARVPGPIVGLITAAS